MYTSSDQVKENIMEPFDSFDEFEEVIITPAKPKRRGGRPKKQEVTEPVEITEDIEPIEEKE